MTTVNTKPLNRNIVLHHARRALAEVHALSKAPCPDKAAFAYRCAYADGVASLAARFCDRNAVDAEFDAIAEALREGALALRTQTRFARR